MGDSRAILSSFNGEKVEALSRDHKPNDPEEKNRIIQSGGKVYTGLFSRTRAITKPIGPPRVHPGGLSVSRSFGDISAKLPSLGGRPNVVIATPEIKEIDLKKEMDFVFIGSDGVFDKLSNEEIAKCVWDSAKRTLLCSAGRSTLAGCSIHEVCGKCSKDVIDLAMDKGSTDNVTGVLIALKGFEKWFNDQKEKGGKENQNEETKDGVSCFKN